MHETWDDVNNSYLCFSQRSDSCFVWIPTEKQTGFCDSLGTIFPTFHYLDNLLTPFSPKCVKYIHWAFQGGFKRLSLSFKYMHLLFLNMTWHNLASVWQSEWHGNGQKMDTIYQSINQSIHVIINQYPSINIKNDHIKCCKGLLQIWLMLLSA